MVDTDTIEARSRALIGSPAGCAFLWLVELSGLTAAQAADPVTSLHLTARVLGAVSVWWPNHTRIVSAACAAGKRLLPVARAILARPETAGWFAPPDRYDQLWLNPIERGSAPQRPVIPTTLPTDWERYAQKPKWGLYTATEIADTSALLADGIEHAGDLASAFTPPLICYRLRVSAQARIYEIDSPAAWRRLCLTYRAPGQESPTAGLVAGDSVVAPDFALVARDWDAVHLSLGGLLTAEQVRMDGPEGPTQLQGWDVEQTVWLRWLFDDIERLPDVQDLPSEPAPLAFIPLSF